MSNYHEFERGLRFLYQEVIRGFQLYEMEHYPYAVRTDDPADPLTVEVFKVTDPEVEELIHNLETAVATPNAITRARGVALRSGPSSWARIPLPCWKYCC